MWHIFICIGTAAVFALIKKYTHLLTLWHQVTMQTLFAVAAVALLLFGAADAAVPSDRSALPTIAATADDIDLVAAASAQYELTAGPGGIGLTSGAGSFGGAYGSEGYGGNAGGFNGYGQGGGYGGHGVGSGYGVRGYGGGVQKEQLQSEQRTVQTEKS